MEPTSRRIRTGVLLAPLAGPPAVFAGSLIRSLVTHAPRDEPFSVAAVLVLLFAFYLFGAPLAYATMLILAWPLTRAARAESGLAWWVACIAGALIGAAVFPAYLHLLAPRGSFDFFPGAGLVAGAAVTGVFWMLSLRPERGVEL